MSDIYSAGVDDYLKTPDAAPGARPLPAPMAVPALKLSVGDAVEAKPDYEAELRRAAQTTGVPIDTARADPKSTLAQAKVLSLNLDGLAETNPHTASFLSDPNNARIAHDDTGALAGVEQVLKNLGNLGKASFFAAAAGSAGYLQAMAPTLRSLGINSAIGGEFDDPKSPMGEYLTALRQASKGAAAKFTPQTDNPWAAGVNSGVINLMQAAPITLGAAITKNPGMAVGAFGALAGGESYGDAKDAGKSDVTATRYAGTQGAIAMLAQAIPLHQLLGDVAEGTGFFKTLGKNLLLSQPAMQAQTLASDFDTWQTLNPDKPVSEFLKERGPAAVNTMIATAMGDVANTSAAHAVGKLQALASSDGENAGKAVQAQQAGVILQQLAEAAKASKLRDRDPQAFHDFVAKATEDGPVENVYIDPRHITDILAQSDSQKLTGDVALLKAMPSVLPQMDEALRTGQDIEIPTSEFAAYAAGSDFAQDLLPHLKTDPNGMSLAESQAFLQSHAEELKASVQKIVKESGQDDATQASAEKVRQSILGELTAANRFTPDVNDAYSHLTAAFYATQAHRLGITPEELHAQYPLKVAAEDVSGGAKLDQPVYHGTPHEFDAFSLDHIGTGEGAQSFGHGLYFAGNKEIAEYYRNTLSGRDLPKIDGTDILKWAEKPTEEIRQDALNTPIELPHVEGLKPEDVEAARKSFGWAAFAHAITETRLYDGTAEDRLGKVAERANKEADREADRLAGLDREPTRNELAEVAGFRLRAAYANALAKSGRVTAAKPGRLYHVEIPEDHHYLDWDKPLRAQPEGVQAALKKLGIDIPEAPKLTDVKDPEERSVLEEALSQTYDPSELDGPHQLDDPVGNVELVIDNDHELYDRVLALAEARGYDPDKITDNGVGHYFTRLPDVWEHLTGLKEKTGEDAYKGLSKSLAAHRWNAWEHQGREGPFDPAGASEALRKEGVAGIRYLDGGSRSAGEGRHNYVLFDAAHAKITHFEQGSLAQGEKEPRGAYDPNADLIVLLKGADLSTYLHESGHFYLETLARIAAEKPDSEIAQDMDKALAFMGHKGKTAAEWLALPLDERREGHELFARGFEAYLMEGKAPSTELRGVFQRFRSWLVSVYKSVTGLKVELNDEVRGVFDRMLASDQQIEDHQTALGFTPLFKDAASAGMNPQEWTAYQRLGADATASAVDQLETRSIRDMRWASGAKDRMVAKLQREAATKRKSVQSEVTAEVMAEPINRARQLLKFGLLDGQEQEGNTKLSLPALREMYGEHGTATEELAGINKPKVPYRDLGFGKYGMLAEDGVHPDHVAELLGFSSGDELVRELLTAEPAKVTIEGKTDQRMLERYGDLVDRDSIDKAADEAIHNDARLRFVATEANALAKATGGQRVLAEAAKGYADNMVGGVKVRDLKPVKYQVAESRAAKAAERYAAKGDLVGAATEKRNQVINGYAARAAQDAQAEIAKAVRYFAKFASAGTRKALDPDYRDQIDSLLERFDLSKNTTLRAIDKRKSLVAWVARMAEDDIEPMIPEDLLNEAYRKSYKDMSVDDVRALRDTVRQIEHLARLKNKLLSAKDARNFADTIEATTGEVEKNAIGKPRDLIESNQLADKMEENARGYFVAHRKFDSLITRLAGFVDKRDPGNSSTLWSVLVRPKNEAADREATRVQASTEELQRIFKALAPDRVRQKVFIPEINNSLSLEGRLAVLLNWGNETSRQRVVDGDHWTDAQVQAIFKTLEPRHFKFAQDLIDHVESFKGEVAAAHKRRYGIEPPMIEASPFEAVASDGSTVQMRGGYYPIKYDPNRSAKAADFDVIKETKRAIVGSTKGFVKAGFYKARQDTVENRPVSKSFNAAFSHLTEVIHDLEWGDYLIDAKRLLHNETLGNSIRAHAGPEILKSLKNSVQAMEVGDIPAQNAFQKAIQYLNTGTTLAGLGWNFIVSTKHPLGLFNGAARIGPKWIGVGLKRWIGDAASLQNTVEWVHEKSEFMKSRAHGRLVTRDLQDVSGKMTTGLTSDLVKQLGGAKAANALHTTGTAIEHSFYWMIERGQMIADIPTWIGQYEKSMEAHGDDAKAVQQANQAVRDSQTTGGFSDLPEIQRGGPLMKLFTKFYSYFTVVYNQLAESAEETRFRGVSNVPALAGDVMLAMILPALAGATIQRFLPGGDQRDDWAKYLGQHLLADLFGTMIGVRDMYAAFTEDKDAPAGFRFMKNTADLGKLVEKGDTNTPQFWKALNAEGGVLFHYPSATVQRFVTGVQAMAEGQTHNPLVVMTGPHPKPRP